MFTIPGSKAFLMEFMYTSILYQHCCNNVCGGWGSYEINLKELTIPKHYLLSVVPHHLVGPPGKSRNFQHARNGLVSHPKVKSFPDENKFMYTSFVFIRKAFNLGVGNKPYCGYRWCVGNSVISRVAQPGGEAPHLEDNVWEWSTPSSWFHTTLIHHKHCCNNVDIRYMYT